MQILLTNYPFDLIKITRENINKAIQLSSDYGTLDDIYINRYDQQIFVFYYDRQKEFLIDLPIIKVDPNYPDIC